MGKATKKTTTTTTNELIEVVPGPTLEQARKSYDQAVAREKEATGRLIALRTVKGDTSADHTAKLLGAELAELRLKEEVFECGVVLDEALRNEAMASDDPRVRAASPQTAIVDCEQLAAKATRLRRQVADRIAEIFSTGGDIREFLAELSTLESVAEQAEKLILSRLRYGFESRTKLASERHAAGLPKPPPFPSPGAHEGNAAHWMRLVREAIHAGLTTERQGYRQRIAKMAGDHTRVCASIEQQRIDREETAARHAAQAEYNRKAEERRATERAKEIAAAMAEADAQNRKAAELAASYLKRNG